MTVIVFLGSLMAAMALGVPIAFSLLLCGVALIALGWLMWQTGNDFSSAGETTAQLKILKSPFIYGMGVLCAFTGFIHLSLMRNPLNHEASEGGVL